MTVVTKARADIAEIDETICSVIENTIDIQALREIAAGGAACINALGAVAANRRCPADLLRQLYDNANNDIVVLMNVADNPHTPPDILASLATHDDWVVRMVVAHNPASISLTMH